MYFNLICLFLFFLCFSSAQNYLLFEDNFNNNQNNWTLGDRAKTLADIRDGVFYFEGKKPKYNYSRRKEIGYLRLHQDFEIEIRLRQVAGTSERGFGLEWGGNSLDNTFYEFWLRNDGSYSIDKFEGNTQTFSDYVKWTSSPLVKINEFNTLLVRKTGGKVYYLLNNREVYQTDFRGMAGCEIGFIVPPLSAIEVDYLRVSLLNKAPETVFTKKEVPAIWVVIAAIADYKNNTTGIPDLHFTVNDAQAMEDFYKSPNGGGVAPENIKVLLNKDATKINMLHALKNLFSKAKENDLLVFYFAGHGIAPAKAQNAFHFIPYEYLTGDLNTAIHYKEIRQIFEESKANKKLWLIDACHSGGSISETQGENIKEKLGKIDDSEIALLTSSDLGETSLEIGEEMRRGLFSYFLSEGLWKDTDKSDENKDGYVSIYELFDYAKQKTKITAHQRFGHKQTPQIGGKFNVQLPLSKVISNIDFEFDK